MEFEIIGDNLRETFNNAELATYDKISSIIGFNKFISSKKEDVRKFKLFNRIHSDLVKTYIKLENELDNESDAIWDVKRKIELYKTKIKSIFKYVLDNNLASDIYEQTILDELMKLDTEYNKPTPYRVKTKPQYWNIHEGMALNNMRNYSKGVSEANMTEKLLNMNQQNEILRRRLNAHLRSYMSPRNNSPPNLNLTELEAATNRGHKKKIASNLRKAKFNYNRLPNNMKKWTKNKKLKGLKSKKRNKTPRHGNIF